MNNVRVTTEGLVGRITLARPEKKNALNRETAEELAQSLFYLNNADVTVVGIDAEGTDFCAGADLAALEEMLEAPRQAHLEDAQALGHVFHTIRRMEKPVVALVRGRAYAGGAGLATACDIVLASDDARFAYPEVSIGFVPAMVMTMLRRCVGEKQAFDLVASGRVLSAEEARQLGLVSRVFPGLEFEARSTGLLKQLSQAPASAMSATKSLFYKLDAQNFLDGITAGIVANAEARATTEFRDGVRKFTARKKDSQ